MFETQLMPPASSVPRTTRFRTPSKASGKVDAQSDAVHLLHLELSSDTDKAFDVFDVDPAASDRFVGPGRAET